MTEFTRADGRALDQMRSVRITRNFTTNPAGSVLVEFGNTRVMCTASVELGVPRFKRDSGEGWLTAEYAMLPSATHDRMPRGSMRGKVKGRTHEISRLVGRSLRAAVDLEQLGIPFSRAHKDELLRAGLAVMAAVDATDEPVHPERPDVRGCHHVYLKAPGSNAELSRHAMAIHPGWFDRSPCGTGTSARMAELWARGELALGTDFVNESYIGSRFVGRPAPRSRRGIAGITGGGGEWSI